MFGGAEVDLYFISTELARDPDFKVSFITADYGQDPIESRDGIRLIKSYRLKANPLYGMFKIWQAMKKADADIYMMKTLPPGMSLVAWFCWFHKRIFVYRTPSSKLCDGSYFKGRPLLGVLYRWALKSARAVSTQNQSDAEMLATVYNRQATVIPNGFRLPLHRVWTKQTILWVGRSAEVKQPEVFFKLACDCPAYSFVMICPRATGDNHYEALVEKAKGIDNLEFIAGVAFDQVDRYFQQAQVFVNTSRSEGFPNTFIQACMAATPILTLNINPDEFLSKNHCGICCNNDYNRLLETLRSVIENNTYDQMGLNARNYVKAKHDIVAIVKVYKHSLRELIPLNTKT